METKLVKHEKDGSPKLLFKHQRKKKGRIMKTQLLCTFTTQHNLEQSIRDITKNFKVVFEKIYVLTKRGQTKRTDLYL